MSQRSDLREDLARWLQDTINVQWTAAVVNRYLNLGLRETEKHILAVDPEAFKCVYTAATVVPSTGKDNIYSYPAGTFAVHEIARSSDGVNYVPLQRLNIRNVRQDRSGDIGEITRGGFVPWDSRHFVLWPSASSAVSAGLRCTVAPTLVMADDTDENPVPPAFEQLMMLETQLICLYDTGEDPSAVEGRIKQIKNETPRFYLTNSEPPFIDPLGRSRYPG